MDLGLNTRLERQLETQRVMVEGKGGVTFLWRRCCLMKAIRKFRYRGINGPQDSGSDERFYNWYLTHSIGGIIIAPRLRNWLDAFFHDV